MIDRSKSGNHPCQKLTPDDVIAIRAAEGSQRDIAARFCVTQATISKIKRREAWAWLDGKDHEDTDKLVKENVDTTS